MAKAQIILGELGGGGNIDFEVDASSKPAGSYTYHTDNAFAIISHYDYSRIWIQNGEITEVVNNYPAQFSVSYDTSTKTLTLAIIQSSSTPCTVAYNDLG